MYSVSIDYPLPIGCAQIYGAEP